MSNKTIYEMNEKELNTLKKDTKSEISTLTVEFSNNTVNMVFGRKYEVKMIYDGKETTVTDFIETKTFEEIIEEGTENYGVLCGNLFSKKDGVNNTEVKEITKNLGVSKKIFWNIIWKKIKINYLEKKLEKISNQIQYLKEKEEEEKKVGE